jgi:allantoicase
MNDMKEIPLFARSNINLASAKLRARATAKSNDFFAPMARMLQDSEPVFIPGKYDDHGKWMDGWESRRRRDDGHDWVIVALAARGVIHGFDIDTRFFTGNYPPYASIEGCDEIDGPEDSTKWREIVPRMALEGDSHHFVEVTPGDPVTHLRLNIFPDGGVARLRAYGRAVPARVEGERDLASALSGARCIAWSDSHFGDPQCLLYPGRGEDMGDGWETKRRRGPGNDWMILALGMPGEVDRVVVDTAHFKGNYPDRCSLEAVLMDDPEAGPEAFESVTWLPVMDQVKLEMDHIHEFTRDQIHRVGRVSHVRFNIFPDGGVSRLRVFGRATG